MRIRHNITLDDYKAYQAAFRSVSPEFLKIRCLQSFGGPSFLVFFVWLLTYYEYGWWPTAIALTPAAGLGFYLWKESPGLWVRANLDERYRKGELDGHLGEHQLEFREDGILERNKAGEHLSHWEQINKIYSTESRTFFCTISGLGYILPKRSVIEGDYDEFVRVATEEWRKRRAKLCEGGSSAPSSGSA
jgi:hypothetical protein